MVSSHNFGMCIVEMVPLYNKIVNCQLPNANYHHVAIMFKALDIIAE